MFSKILIANRGKLVAAYNAGDDSDGALLAKLGMTALEGEEPMRKRNNLELHN